MKRLILLFLFCSLSNLFIHSQTTNSSESQRLNQQVASLYQEGKYEEAIKIAEKIVDIQKSKSDRDWISLATAISNLAKLQKAHYEALSQMGPAVNLSKEKYYKKMNYLESIPALFEEVIKIYNKKLKLQDLRLAESQFELASFTNRTQGAFPYLGSTETEKIENLYSKSLAIRERLLGENHDLTLSTVLTIADFYHNDGEFEKSLPLYKQFIEEIEKKYGKDSQYLLLPLRTYGKLLSAIDLKEEFYEVTKQISNITGKSESKSDYILDLSLRNKRNKSTELIEDPSTITSYLKKEKFLMVNVLIDEKGRVVEAKAGETEDRDIKGNDVQKKAEKKVLNWKFKPFIYNGKPRKIRGIVWYPYFVKA